MMWEQRAISNICKQSSPYGIDVGEELKKKTTNISAINKESRFSRPLQGEGVRGVLVVLHVLHITRERRSALGY